MSKSPDCRQSIWLGIDRGVVYVDAINILFLFDSAQWRVMFVLGSSATVCSSFGSIWRGAIVFKWFSQWNASLSKNGVSKNRQCNLTLQKYVFYQGIFSTEVVSKYADFVHKIASVNLKQRCFGYNFSPNRWIAVVRR